MNEEHTQRKLSAIFYADVAGYSRLMQDNEMATINTLSRYRDIMAGLIRQHRGRVVDMSGDSVMAEFPSVVDAVQSAVVIQKELKSQNAALPANRHMRFRIGINIGDVIQEGELIYGDGVNIAARLETLAEPGGICISRTAYDQIESKLPLGYEYIGQQAVKNISRPLHAYRVILESDEQSSGPEAEEEETEKPRFEKRERHFKHHPRHEQFEKSFHKAKDHLKDFAKDIKEDEELGETFKDIKGRIKSFADEVSGSPERRQKAFQALINNQHVRWILGIGVLLFVINAVTSFGRWWFLLPFVSVSLAIYLHWLKTAFFSEEKLSEVRARIRQKERARLGEVVYKQAGAKAQIEKRIDQRISFYRHLYAYVGVNIFLILINLISNPFHWWFHFPLLIWGAVLFFHWMKMK